jgi:hypothetical protein
MPPGIIGEHLSSDIPRTVKNSVDSNRRVYHSVEDEISVDRGGPQLWSQLFAHTISQGHGSQSFSFGNKPFHETVSGYTVHVLAYVGRNTNEVGMCRLGEFYAIDHESRVRPNRARKSA